MSSAAPGLGAEKIPEDEAQYRQEDDEHGPQDFPACIRQVPGAGSNDLTVVLTNDPQRPITSGRSQPDDGDAV